MPAGGREYRDRTVYRAEFAVGSAIVVVDDGSTVFSRIFTVTGLAKTPDFTETWALAAGDSYAPVANFATPAAGASCVLIGLLCLTHGVLVGC